MHTRLVPVRGMGIVVVRGARRPVPYRQCRLLGRGELIPLDHGVADELFLVVRCAFVDHGEGSVDAGPLRPLLGEVLVEGLTRQLLLDDHAFGAESVGMISASSSSPSSASRGS